MPLIWTLVIVAVGEISRGDALSISLTQPGAELKAEHFENRNYQIRDPGPSIKRKNTFRRPATQAPEIEVPIPPAAEPVLEAEAPVLSHATPPEGFSGMLMGGNLSQVSEFRKSLDDRDLRKNWLELSFAPRWVSSQSSSTYWARETQSKQLGFFIEGKFWVSPLFGMVLDYGGSLSGTIQKQYGSEEMAPISQSWVGVGVRFRRFFGSHKKISSFAWGLDARQREQRIVADATDKLNTRSRAIFLTADSRIPVNPRWAMTLQVALAPWVNHLESGGLNGDSSGTAATSTAYILGLGFEYLFDRGNRLFLRAKGDFEANQFHGGSALQDPRSGLSARGLSVSQTNMIFEIGYTWGQ